MKPHSETRCHVMLESEARHLPEESELKKVLYRKGKAIPVQAWTGPEGCRRLRLPDFETLGT